MEERIATAFISFLSVIVKNRVIYTPKKIDFVRLVVKVAAFDHCGDSSTPSHCEPNDQHTVIDTARLFLNQIHETYLVSIGTDYIAIERATYPTSVEGYVRFLVRFYVMRSSEIRIMLDQHSSDCAVYVVLIFRCGSEK